MERREFLGVVAASSVGGCTSWAEDGRDCSDLEGVVVEPFCSKDKRYYLDIDPSRIEIPATVTFTVVNDDDRELTVERSLPEVYRKVDSGWTEAWPVRRRPERDRVTVSDRHSYEQELPFGSWDPGPGEYLIVVPAVPDEPGNFRTWVYLGDFVELET